MVSECSLPCDDTLKGGMQSMKREVIVKATQFGSPCPALTSKAPCNQHKCPVDCVLANWTVFSECTKECGGGVESRTRSIAVSPKHAGKACAPLIETRPCNTGSCDVDCEIGDWMPQGGCSKACNAGHRERRRKLL